MVESVAVAQRESASVSPEEVDDSMLPVTPDHLVVEDEEDSGMTRDSTAQGLVEVIHADGEVTVPTVNPSKIAQARDSRRLAAQHLTSVDDRMADVSYALGIGHPENRESMNEFLFAPGTAYTCLRCSHAWNSRKAGRPVACGGCKSRSWWAKESRKAPHVKVTAAMEGMR